MAAAYTHEFLKRQLVELNRSIKTLVRILCVFYGDKFDQPERVGVLYKSQSSSQVNLVDPPQAVRDFHSGKMLDEITSKERSPENFLPSGKSGYTRRNSKDNRDRSKSRSQGRKYS